MGVLFFCIWILLNGRVTTEIIVFGLVISAALLIFLMRFMGWSWKRERFLFQVAPLLALYLCNLLRETIIAAWNVLIVAFNPGLHPEPVLIEFHSGLPREYQNVLLANSITLTPGTITVFQEHDRFVVHALRKEYADGLENSSFIKILKKFP